MTEEYSCGYQEGYQEGWNAAVDEYAKDKALAQPAAWVGLTDEEVDELDCVKAMWQDYESCEIHGIKEFASAIEAKLLEKNAAALEKGGAA